MNSSMCEPVRLASFLRERCSRNLYGLRYLNPEQTLMQIPWPVVPKQSNGVPPGFQLFQDWTALSFMRRGRNRDCGGDKELPTNQKHRFRNALARANGIVYRHDIKVEGARVYEFVDQTHKPYAHLPTVETNVSPLSECSPTFPLPDHYNAALCSKQALPFLIDPNEAGTAAGCDGQSFSDPADDILGLFNDSSPENESVFNGSPLAAAAFQQPTYRHPCEYPVPYVPAEQPDLEIKVCFREYDAWRGFVTSDKCRLFFGKNVQNLSQRLAKEQLDEIMKKFRFNKDYYFGPESIQQIELPRPDDFMKTVEQKRKTEQILENMERGLLLYVDKSTKHIHLNVPDVYAARLCQTRVFPCNEEYFNENRGMPTPDTLQRMEWTKVFDGKKFSEQFPHFDQMKHSAYPSPSFALSLGQRPSSDEKSLLFITLNVTVLQAQQLVQSRLDCERDISISIVNSTDMEARSLATQLSATLNLTEGEVF